MVGKLNELCRNMIRLTITEKEQHKLGGTRFGGIPDVPGDFVWPTFETSTFDDDEVKNRPLSFIAQFNCSDIAELDSEGLLPSSGLLSFFYEVGSQRWGFDPKDAGCAKVYWFTDITELKIAELPSDLSEDYCFPSLKIKLTSEKSLPVWEDFSLAYKDYAGNWNNLSEAKASVGIEEYDNCSKLLGWPDIIQNNITRECELVSRGFYLGDTWENISKKDIEEAEATSIDSWRLLFQLDVVVDEDFELMFGDCGRIYFYIRKEDLHERKFDNVWLTLQCC